MLVKFYEEQFRLSKHRQFGPSSEKGDSPEQFGLFDEAENVADIQKSEPELEEITYTRRELAVIPAQIKVIEHRRAVYSCRSCKGTATMCRS